MLFRFVYLVLFLPHLLLHLPNHNVLNNQDKCPLQDNRFLMAAPLFGYGFAWVGHFVFEKNRPATFKQPIFSLMGDFVMWYEVLTMKRNLKSCVVDG